MNTKRKIKVIYDKIANKNLSEGCKINYKGTETIIINTRSLYGLVNGGHIYNSYNMSLGLLGDFDIIGHQVMIGDVLDYFLKNGLFLNLDDIILFVGEIWDEKRKPIEDQSVECIIYIYNLIKK